MEKFNETQPQEGNQVVVNKNTGTINITNHSDKIHEKMIQGMIDLHKRSDEIIIANSNLIQRFSKTIEDLIEKENKKNRRK